MYEREASTLLLVVELNDLLCSDWSYKNFDDKSLK